MSRSDDNDICVICLEPINDQHMTFYCEHKLHYPCFQEYLYYHYNIENKNILCPTCRTTHERNIMFIVNFLLLNNNVKQHLT